jgi:hypothetical protein
VAQCVRGERHGGCTVIWLANQGQNRHFMSLMLSNCGEDGRRTLMAMEASSLGMGQTGSSAMAAPALSMGRVGQPPFLRSSSISPLFRCPKLPRILSREP